MTGENPFRLLIVGIKWPPETFIMRKIERLVQSGVHVSVVIGGLRGRKLDGLTIIECPSSEDSRLLQVAVFVRYALVLASTQQGRAALAYLLDQSRGRSLKSRFVFLTASFVLARQSSDLVHFEWNSSAIENLHMFHIWRCSYVVSCRGRQVNVSPHMPSYDRLKEGLRITFQQAAAVHCVSAAIKQEALQYGLDPAKGRVIRPAVDPEFFYPLNEYRAASAIFRVITVGALIWRKAYEYALLAIRELVEQGIPVHCEIVGDGPERQRVLYTIDDLCLTEYVQLAGKLSPVEVRERLQQADVFMLSSLSEGISNAVLEAMACGLPVVTTDCGGMREAVTDGVEGFVVPVRNPAAMAAALRTLALDPDLRATMGARARERIVREFTLEQQTEQVLSLYREVLQRKRT